jgi:hypothetical protein
VRSAGASHAATSSDTRPPEKAPTSTGGWLSAFEGGPPPTGTRPTPTGTRPTPTGTRPTSTEMRATPMGMGPSRGRTVSFRSTSVPFPSRSVPFPPTSVSFRVTSVSSRSRSVPFPSRSAPSPTTSAPFPSDAEVAAAAGSHPGGRRRPGTSGTRSSTWVGRPRRRRRRAGGRPVECGAGRPGPRGRLDRGERRRQGAADRPIPWNSVRVPGAASGSRPRQPRAAARYTVSPTTAPSRRHSGPPTSQAGAGASRSPA